MIIQMKSSSYYFSNEINQLLPFKWNQSVITFQKLCSIKWNQPTIIIQMESNSYYLFNSIQRIFFLQNFYFYNLKFIYQFKKKKLLPFKWNQAVITFQMESSSYCLSNGIN